MTTEKFARKAILPLEPNYPYTTAEDIRQKHGLAKMAVLDSNENPLGSSPLAVQAIRDAAVTCNTYPDNSSSVLRQKVAARFGIEDKMVLFGNGADNVLLMLGSAFLNPGEEMLVCEPYFFVYQTIVAMQSGILRTVAPTDDYRTNLQALKQAIGPKTKLVMVCNPNNPTGTIVTQDEIREFMDGIPEHCIVIFDEAYGEFAEAADDGFASAVSYIKEGRNVMVIRTLSKTYGLAGIRVGYIMGPYHLIETMMRVQEPYTVNILAQAAASAALEDKKFLQDTLDLTNEGRAYLNRELRNLGVHCLPSYTNFIFCDFGRNAAEIQQKLAEKGYLIRVGGGWNMPTFARITIGTMEQNRGLIQALEKML